MHKNEYLSLKQCIYMHVYSNSNYFEETTISIGLRCMIENSEMKKNNNNKCIIFLCDDLNRYPESKSETAIIFSV